MGKWMEGNKEKQARNLQIVFKRKEGTHSIATAFKRHITSTDHNYQPRGYKQLKHTVKISWVKTSVGVWKCVWRNSVWRNRAHSQVHTHKKSWRTLQEVGGHLARKGGDIRLEHFKQREQWWATPKTNKTQQGRRVRGNRAKGRGSNFISQTKQKGVRTSVVDWRTTS